MSTTTTFPFTTSGNYTASDSEDIGVSGGNGTLLDRIPSDGTFFCNFSSSTTANWSDGTAAPSTSSGSPTISGGYLVLDASEYVRWVGGDGNIPAGNTGCIRFVVQPQYSGNPGATQMFVISFTLGGSNDKIEIKHDTSGNLLAIIRDEAANGVVNISHAWSPTSGTDYEIELNWDGTNGATRLFLDGTQVGSTDNSTFTRSLATSNSFLDVGLSATQAFEMDYLVIYDAVQHTSNYTSNGEPAAVSYATDNPTLTTNTTVSGGLRSFTADTTASGSDAIKFVLQVAGQDKYWTGSTWANSSSYSQSNTATEINNNIQELHTGNDPVKIKVYLHSDDGSTTPTINEMSITYDAADASATTPTLVFLEGWLYDYNSALSGETVEVRPTVGFVNEEIFLNGAWKTFATSADDGYFSGYIYSSAGVGKTWEFRIGGKKYRAQIPDQTSVKFSDLTITPVTNGD